MLEPRAALPRALPATDRRTLQPAADWWGARLARLTLVLFWQLVALPPLVYCVRPPPRAAAADLEREPEPTAGRALARTMEQVLLLPGGKPSPASARSPAASASLSPASTSGFGSASAATSSGSSPSLPSPATPSASPETSPASKQRQVEPLRSPRTQDKQSPTRADETPDASRRQSFSAMAADSRASMRRRSCDLAAGELPAALHAMGASLPDKGHLQHLRVYGRANPTPVTASPTLGPASSRAWTRSAREDHVEGVALAAVQAPAPGAVWTRGRPVDIEWKVLDASVPALAIELLEEGSSATTLIAREAPNSGRFTYHRVPWGMAVGDKYFLKLSPASVAASAAASVATAAPVSALVSSSARYTTTGFFSISSAP